MPNHVHLLLVILPDDQFDDLVGVADLRHLQKEYDRTKMRLSKVIQQLKSSISRSLKASFIVEENLWQRSFHDRIIRNTKEIDLVREYIEHNPVSWGKDKYYET